MSGGSTSSLAGGAVGYLNEQYLAYHEVGLLPSGPSRGIRDPGGARRRRVPQDLASPGLRGLAPQGIPAGTELVSLLEELLRGRRRLSSPARYMGDPQLDARGPSGPGGSGS